MKLVTVVNPSDKDVEEFPIAEPELINNEVRYDENGSILSTGKTLLWTLEAGTTKKFPEYVAKELLKTYEFLVTEEDTQVESVEEEVSTNPLVCKHCGQEAKNIKGLGLHIASKHPEKL